MSETTVWRMYASGSVKNQSHVLWPHSAEDKKCAGYDGDVDAWSEHNKQFRPGCAQIVRHGNQPPVVLHQGGVSAELTDAFVEAHTL